jgi:hypothetical protein
MSGRPGPGSRAVALELGIGVVPVKILIETQPV